MVFSSIAFLFYYLPLIIILTYIFPKRFRNGILLIGSLLFYGFGEPIYVVLMILSVLIDYTNGRFIEKFRTHEKLPKLFLFISILANLSLLGFFKYGDFVILNINDLLSTQIPLLNLGLPIGISFFTFQTMSYSIDVYRGNIEAEKNIITFGAYVSMFPQLIAGPIILYKDVVGSLKNRKVSMAMLNEGIMRFILGLGKKVLLANNIGLLFETVKKIPVDEISMATAWLGAIAFSFQIYFDFSGYSDMAIGLGKILGFDFLENFNYPFMSKSITEFWRRWHMSLSYWFRDYLYIPLGGSRHGTVKTIRNITIVWFLTGLWHGAAWNYILWGIYFAIILIMEKFVLKKFLASTGNLFKRTYSLILIVISFTIFSLEDLDYLATYLRTMFGDAILWNMSFIYLLQSFSILLIIGIVASTPYPFKRFKNLFYSQSPVRKSVSQLMLLLIFFISLAFIVDGSYNPFLYFRF
ncbi:MAG: MBOAT family protein [Clostridium sp.]|nr:MBOAT family protein [Clostridium sp.]